MGSVTTLTETAGCDNARPVVWEDGAGQLPAPPTRFTSAALGNVSEIMDMSRTPVRAASNLVDPRDSVSDFLSGKPVVRCG